MSTKARLPFQPGILETLQISADGDIVYAFDNKIFIQTLNFSKLFPCWQIDKQPPAGPSPWAIANFKVSGGSVSGAFREFGENFDTLSIGQVPSSDLITAHAWSKCRVGKLNRQVLAVLTSKLELRLWEATEAPSLADSWQAFASIHDSVSQHLKNYGEKNALRRRRRSRIRAFCWGAPMISNEDIQLLAITNDYNEIIVVRISHVQDSERKISVIASLPARGQSADKDLVGTAILAREETHVRKIAWSSWEQEMSGLQKSLIAYASRGQIRVRPVILTLDSGTSCQFANDECILNSTPSSKTEARALVWSDKAVNGVFSLAFETLGSIYVAHVHIDGKVLSTKRLDYPHWEPPSGMFFLSGPHERGSSQLHMVSANGKGIAIDVPSSWQSLSKPDSLSVTNSPTWQKELHEETRTFDRGHDLYGTAIARVWGMVASPLSGQAVLSATFHPGDMLEYKIPVQEISTTIFDRALGGLDFWLNDIDALLSSRVSTEGLVSEIGLQDPIASDRDDSSTPSTVMRHLLTQYLESISHDGALPPPSSTLFEINDRLRSLLSTRPLKAARLLNIVSNLRQQTAENQYAILLKRHLKTILDFVALPSTLQNLPCPVCDLPLSKKGGQSTDPETMDIDGAEGAGGEAAETGDAPLAVCGNDHVFVSCSLTGVPICNIGQSRYCRVCGLEYLSEAGVSSLFNDAGHQSRDIELLRSLVRACVTCFFCGGGFVNKRV